MILLCIFQPFEIDNSKLSKLVREHHLEEIIEASASKMIRETRTDCKARNTHKPDPICEVIGDIHRTQHMEVLVTAVSSAVEEHELNPAYGISVSVVEIWEALETKKCRAHPLHLLDWVAFIFKSNIRKHLVEVLRVVRKKVALFKQRLPSPYHDNDSQRSTMESQGEIPEIDPSPKSLTYAVSIERWAAYIESWFTSFEFCKRMADMPNYLLHITLYLD